MFDPEKVERYDGSHGPGMVGDVMGMYVHIADYKQVLQLYRLAERTRVEELAK